MTRSAWQFPFINCTAPYKLLLLVLVMGLATFKIDAQAVESNITDQVASGSISYFIWLDLDADGSYMIGEQMLKDLEVRLYDASNNNMIQQFELIDEGRFFFRDLTSGMYYIQLRFLNALSSQHIQGSEVLSLINHSEGSYYQTANFIFDPNQSSRKDIDLPFEYIEEAEETVNLLTCTDFIEATNTDISIENCANMASICIEEPIGEMLAYSITDNGMAYTGGINPCDFDTSFAYTYTSIPDAGLNGVYHVDNWTVNGNSFDGTVADMSALTDSMNLWDSSASWIHDPLTSSIRGGSTATTYGSIEISQVATGNNAMMSLNTTLNPNGTQLSLDTGYHQLIFIEPIESCTDTLEILIECTDCPILYAGPSNFELDNCADQESVCFDISTSSSSDYTITDNGFGYSGIVEACGTDSFYEYNYAGIPGSGTGGPYLLQNWTINGTIYTGGFNHIGALVDSMNVWDIGGEWTISDPLQNITGGHASKTYSDIEILQIITGNSGTIPISVRASISSLEVSLDTGFHEIVFHNTANECRDTFELEFSCAPCPNYLDDDPLSIMTSHCDSSIAICLDVPFAEIGDYSALINGIAYTNGFELCGAANSSISLDTGIYQLILIHQITSCMDTTNIQVTCPPIIVCNDFINEDSLHVQIADCENNAALCVEINFENILDYTILDNGVTYNGTLEDCNAGVSLGLEIGAHQLVFEHTETGCRDSLSSLVACINTMTIDWTMIMTETDTICLDLSELPGTFTAFENICEASSEEQLLWEWLPETHCLEIEAIEEGMVQLCGVVCDDYGFCDTTMLNIEILPLIIEPELDPVAMDDEILIEQGQSATIIALDNDLINGELNSMGILEAPIYGTAVIQADQTIMYSPNPDFCTTSVPDSFVYVICNDIACDEAVVRVAVNCSEISVHNGFSPNGDGMNDYFVVNGATTKADNILSVFNRWGVRVFYTKAYQNDWNGTWDGLDLPDGTYFYYYEDGTGSTASGYVMLQR